VKLASHALGIAPQPEYQLDVLGWRVHISHRENSEKPYTCAYNSGIAKSKDTEVIEIQKKSFRNQH
jgi:hypothetical protein